MTIHAALTTRRGEVAERLNAPVLKTGKLARASGVRISPSPPESITYIHTYSCLSRYNGRAPNCDQKRHIRRCG